MIRDWLFADESNICGFRAAGVLIRDNELLLQSHGNEFALPGGHVVLGETAEDAIIREFKEEIRLDILCAKLLWIEESFWNWGSKKAHSISFYYLTSLKDGSDISGNFLETSKDNKDVLFQWASLEDLGKIAVYPSFVKYEIKNISGDIKHFVTNTWEN